MIHTEIEWDCPQAPSDSPPPRARPIGFTIVHLALGTLVAVTCASWDPRGNSYVRVAVFGFFVGQAGLVGIWAGLNGSRWYWRLLGAVCGMVYLGVMFAIFTHESATLLAASVLVVPTAAAALVARLCGVQTVTRGNASSAVAQFSLRDLVLFTFFVAVLLSLAKCLVFVLPPPASVGREILAVFGIAAATAIVGIFPVWPILGVKHRPLLGTVAPVLIGAAVAAALDLLFSSRWTWQGLMALTVDALTVIVSLYVLRYWGVRLVWRSRRAERVESTPAGEEAA